MVMLFLLIYYAFVFDPRLDPFRVLGDNTSKARHVNIADDIVLCTVRTSILNKIRTVRPFSWTTRRKRLKGGRLEDTFNKVGNIVVISFISKTIPTSYS